MKLSEAIRTETTASSSKISSSAVGERARIDRQGALLVTKRSVSPQFFGLTTICFGLIAVCEARWRTVGIVSLIFGPLSFVFLAASRVHKLVRSQETLRFVKSPSRGFRGKSVSSVCTILSVVCTHIEPTLTTKHGLRDVEYDQGSAGLLCQDRTTFGHSCAP